MTVANEAGAMNGSRVEAVLKRLTNVRATSNGWMASCPAHNDRTPSLSIGEGADGRVLLTCHTGCDIEAIADGLGMTVSELFERDASARPPVPALTITPRKRHERVRRTIKKVLSGLVANVDRLERYLRFRGLSGRVPPALKFHPALTYFNGAFGDTQQYPTMIGEVQALDGTLVTLHRTYLSKSDDGKADVEEPKKLMGVVKSGATAGAAIRLAPAGNRLALTEGIETGLAVMQATGTPTWATLSARGLEVVELPSTATEVEIWADNDGPGQHSAEIAAQRFQGEGRSVKIITPEQSDLDWLDVLVDSGADALQAASARAEIFVPVPHPSEGAVWNGIDRDRWIPIPLSELAAGDNVAWIWHGYLARQTITSLTGMWKAGKTTLVTHLLKALSEKDKTFIGRTIAPVTTLVVSEEARQMWIIRRDELGLGDQVYLIQRPFKGNATLKEWVEFVECIAAMVREQAIGLVIFDSLPNLWPVDDENNAARVRQALTPLQQIAEANAAVLVVAHPRKNDAQIGQAMRGSGMTMGFVDIIMEMRRVDPERGSCRRMISAQGRFDETPAEVVIDYDADSGYTLVGNKAEAVAADYLEAILHILSTATKAMTDEEIRDAWPVGQGVAKPSAKKIRRLVEAGPAIERSGAGVKGDPIRYRLRAPSGEGADSIPDSSTPNVSVEPNVFPKDENQNRSEV